MLSSWRISDEIFRSLSSEFTIERILPPPFAPHASSSNLRHSLALYRVDISRLILLHREEPAVGAFAFARVDWQKDEHDDDGDTSRIVSAAMTATAAEGRCLCRRETSYPKSYPTSPSVDELPQFTNWIPGSSQGRRPARAPPVLTGSDHDKSLRIHPPVLATATTDGEAANAAGGYASGTGGSRSVPHRTLLSQCPFDCTSETASRYSSVRPSPNTATSAYVGWQLARWRFAIRT